MKIYWLFLAAEYAKWKSIQTDNLSNARKQHNFYGDFYVNFFFVAAVGLWNVDQLSEVKIASVGQQI